LITSVLISLSDRKAKGLERFDAENKLSRLLTALGYDVLGIHILGEQATSLIGRDILEQAKLIMIVGGVGNKILLEKLGNLYGLKIVVNDNALSLIQSRIFEISQDLKKAYSKEELKKYEKYSLTLEGAYVLPNSKGIIPGYFVMVKDKCYIVLLPEDFPSIRSILEEGLEYYLRNITGFQFSTSINIKVEARNDEEVYTLLQALNKMQSIYVDNLCKKKNYEITVKIFSNTPEDLDNLLNRVKDIIADISKKLGIKISSTL